MIAAATAVGRSPKNVAGSPDHVLSWLRFFFLPLDGLGPAEAFFATARACVFPPRAYFAWGCFQKIWRVRITGDLRGFASGPRAESCDGVSIQLFDAYLTPDDYTPYRPGQELLGFRRFYGDTPAI
jgi:hypothetical protein